MRFGKWNGGAQETTTAAAVAVVIGNRARVVSTHGSRMMVDGTMRWKT